MHWSLTDLSCAESSPDIGPDGRPATLPLLRMSTVSWRCFAHTVATFLLFYDSSYEKSQALQAKVVSAKRSKTQSLLLNTWWYHWWCQWWWHPDKGFQIPTDINLRDSETGKLNSGEFSVIPKIISYSVFIYYLFWLYISITYKNNLYLIKTLYDRKY
jgi:hypothetical protein